MSFAPERVTPGDAWAVRLEQTLPQIALMLGFPVGTQLRAELEGFELHDAGEYVPPMSNDDGAMGHVLVLMRTPQKVPRGVPTLSLTTIMDTQIRRASSPTARCKHQI